jgi:AcrR family transcriptional regulator
VAVGRDPLTTRENEPPGRASPSDLPLWGSVAERADARRNRARIIEAATALVDERGIDGVSMEDVARAACVGTGTLYRRFGDRAGLALALLDEQTREFQDLLIAGPPPLGPGAGPIERLKAFGHAYLDLLERHADLIGAATPHGREGAGPHALNATHVALLVREAAPDIDVDFVTEALLAALTPGQHVYLRRERGWPLDRLKAGWDQLVEALNP